MYGMRRGIIYSWHGILLCMECTFLVVHIHVRVELLIIYYDIENEEVFSVFILIVLIRDLDFYKVLGWGVLPTVSSTIYKVG